MTESDYRRLRQAFTRIASLPRDERDAALRELSAEDEALRREVEALLEHDRSPSDVFDAAASSIARELDAAASPAEQPESIGPYRVLGILGEGGTGTVYHAQQDDPDREVAVKVLRDRLLSRSATIRFNLEIEVLGRLNHPGIARIFDAGTASVFGGQRRYFAMELVRGTTITRFAERHDLSARERVTLFCRVCDAVQHAHQHGVVHRDLKPDNILVEGDLATAEPKVLDFGIARVIGDELAPTSAATLHGQLVGTLAYMSPEQLSGDKSEIDTRADVYALGVVLYELLVGRAPFDVSGSSITEAIRILRETRPDQPSTVTRQFDRELETVVMTAMDRDRSRRYPSASELAADARRWLNDEPIAARPPSRVYVARKFAKRNRVVLCAVALVFVAMATGMLLAISSSVREADARRDSDRLAQLAAEREQATRAALEVSKASRTLLENALQSITPASAQGRDVSLLREVLDDATDAASRDLARFDAERAEMMAVFGNVYLTIGALTEAESTLRQALDAALESGDPELIDESEFQYGAALSHLGDLDRAAKLLEVERPLDLPGRDPLVARRLTLLAEICLNLGDPDAIDRALEATRYAETIDSVSAAKARFVYAAALRRSGQLDNAEAEFQLAADAFTEADDPIGTSTAVNSLAAIARARGDLERAETLYREALGLRKSVDGRPHPQTAVILSNLGRTLFLRDDFSGALATLDEAVAMLRVIYTEPHVRVAIPLATRGRVLSELDRHGDAEKNLTEAVEMLRVATGRPHPFTATSLLDLGHALNHAGEASRAIDAFRDAERECDELGLQSENYRVPIAIGIAEALEQLGRVDEAEAVLTEARTLPGITDAGLQRLDESLAALETDQPRR